MSSKRRQDDNDNNNDDDDDDDREDTQQSQSQYRLLPVFGDHKRAVSSIKFAPSKLTKNKPNAAIVASASASAFIKIWDLQSALQTETEESTTSTSKTLSSSKSTGPSSRKPLQDATVCIGHSRGINDICWNPVAPLLASASDDKTVRLWDAVTGDGLVECKGHDNFVFCIDQYHSMMVSGSFDETVKLWDIRSGECVSTLPAHSDPVTAVGFNRDGTCVCSASHDGLIRIWDVATGECLKTIFAAGNPPVSSVKYSPNGKYLLAGTLDSVIRLWPVNRMGSHKCAKTYNQNQMGHVNRKYSVAIDFTYDGHVLTGSECGKGAVLYDLQSRQILQRLTIHGDEHQTIKDDNNNQESTKAQDTTQEETDDGTTTAASTTDVVLAVSAHDRLPLIATGGMSSTDRKVDFWIKATKEHDIMDVDTSEETPAKKAKTRK